MTVLAVLAVSAVMAMSVMMAAPLNSNPPFLDTEYDRAKVPPYNGNDPRLPLVV